MVTTVGELFARRPVRYGLRGDVSLWERMIDELADVLVPRARDELERIIEHAYAQIVGEPLPKKPALEPWVQVAALTRGHGMSDGLVSPHFWRFTAIEIITDRWAVRDA